MELEDTIREISILLQQAIKAYKKAALDDKELSKLSINQYFYIEAISRLESPTFSELARELNITKPSVTTLVNKLIKSGYLRKTQSVEDKRIYYISLDEKGQKLIEADQKAYRMMAEYFRASLDASELEEFTRLITKITGSLRKI